ncbi:MAG TPA: purine-nucleoside phosphorylase [Actinomycetota bacterium]|nr:purine-nucleoside phosphorylase [Actinomycetota bacterium]
MSSTRRVGVATRPSPGDRVPEEAVTLIRERCDLTPSVAVVLGSGLGEAVEDLEGCHAFSYEGLPGFPPRSVPGHAGRLALGQFHGTPTAVFQGRIHLYEGYGVASTTLVSRVAAELGAGTLILTNASGGLRRGLRPGQLMLLTDHLNLLGVNPLTGWRWPDGTPAFVDLQQVYDPELRELAAAAAGRAGVDLATGVYAALPGPAYETPAEIRYLSSAGADAVGMSTVPEAVAAVALGIRVLGLSCITNVPGAETSHEEVLAAARSAAPGLRTILEAVVSAAGDRT